MTFRGFWDWMYPLMAGDENVEMAALGVLILWFSWYACSDMWIRFSSPKQVFIQLWIY